MDLSLKPFSKDNIIRTIWERIFEVRNYTYLSSSAGMWAC